MSFLDTFQLAVHRWIINYQYMISNHFMIILPVRTLQVPHNTTAFIVMNRQRNFSDKRQLYYLYILIHYKVT